ncbi:MAG: 2-phosphosulfolactate phosphatase, partial [Planctomycetales bacterium]
MSRRLHVHLLPELTTEEALAESHVVVIDVLRASTTIVHALASGAAEVIPCLETDDARELSKRLASDNPLLGGERGGEPIDGFDMGNSPTEYVESKVRGRKIIFTTTNGT